MPESRNLWNIKVQFAAFNMLAISAVGLGTARGGAALLWQLDPLHLSILLGALFVAGLILSAVRVWDVASRLDRPDLDDTTSSAASLEVKLQARIGTVLYVANTLAMSGLACTALGVIIAMRAMAGSVGGDATQAATTIANAMSGIGSAFSLSFVAIMLSLWTKHNFHMLKTAALLLLARQIKGR